MKATPAFKKICIGLLCIGMHARLEAADLYWRPNGSSDGGSGTWQDGGAAIWYTGVYQAWNNANANNADFSGAAGTVTVSGSVSASALLVRTTGYTLTGSDIGIQVPSGLMINVYPGTGNTTINNSLVINVSAANAATSTRYIIANESSGTLTMNGDISLLGAVALSNNRSYDFDQKNASGRTIINGSLAGGPDASGASVRFGENGGVSGAVYELNGSASTFKSTEFVNINRGTVLVGNAGSLGLAAINIGTGATAAGQTAALLTNGAMTIKNIITSGNNGSTSAAYIYGGNTADASEFSGNITSYNDMPLTLRAATGGVVTFSGQFNHQTSPVTKDGPGVVKLTHANFGTGTTTVLAGTLLANSVTAGSSSTGSGNLIVGTGATLGGIGINATGTGKSVTVQSGGVLMGGEGNAAGGALTLYGDVNLASGSTIKLVLGPGLTHSSITRFVDKNNYGAWTFDINQSFAFNVLSGATVGTYSGILSGLNADPGVSTWQISPGSGLTGAFSFDGGNVNLTVTAIPEPAAAGLFGLGVGAFFFLRRNQNRSSKTAL